MRPVNAVYHLAKADFLERIRSYSFLIVLGATMLLAYLLVPVDEANYIVMRFSGYRGFYNSAWIGVMVAMLTAVFFSLPGFYIVKNTITRDLETRVGQIIATTPLSKLHYVLGKFFSNFLVLSVGVGVLIISAAVMQLIRGESLELELWALLSPFIYMTLPVMAIVSALALLFESVSWLRKGFGNIGYFFLWINAITLPLTSLKVIDPFGMNMVLPQIRADVASYLGESGVSVILLGVGERATGAFLWQGITWEPVMLLQRLLWFGVALLILLTAALLFNRFDPSGERTSLTQRTKEPKTEQYNPAPVSTTVETTCLTPAERGFSFARLVMMELRLMLKGAHWWWYLVAAILFTIALFMPDTEQITLLLALTWVWPVLIWSRMGCREFRFGAEQIIFSTPRLIRRQLPATWLAGFTVALVSAGGLILRISILGHWEYLPGIAIGAAFVASLALSLGVISRGSKLFEVIYIVFFWYVGLMNEVPYLDFVGLSEQARALVSPIYHLLAASLLFVAAALVRRRQAA